MHSFLALREIQVAMLFAFLVGVFSAFRQQQRGGESNDELSRWFIWHTVIWTLVLSGVWLMEGAGTNPIQVLFMVLIFVVLASLPVALLSFVLARYLFRKLFPRRNNT